MTAEISGPFGVLGTGVIGSGWATRALGRGYEVVAYDPAPGAEERLRAAIDRAWPFVAKLGLYPDADPARVRFAGSVEEVAERASFIQESVPETLDHKLPVLLAADAASGPDVIIASSTSGLLPSVLQESLRHPERLVVGHPFNPVYLLPLVEVVGGTKTSAAVLDDAEARYRDLDMHPLRVRNEIDGFLSDRLLEALWREILHLVADDVATTGELDEAITFGPGLRWALMGTNLTYHLAGGEGGMRHMLEQFGPALEWPWSKLAAPALTDELVESMVAGTAAQAAGRSIEELERARDEALVAVMYALRETGLGAGAVVNAREARSLDHGAPIRWEPGHGPAAPLALYRCRVAPAWVDYNDHMTESAYLVAFGWASDALFRYIGIDEAYRKAGESFYTVESHIHYYREASTGEALRFSTQLLGHDEKRLHIFHSMFRGESDELLSTNEQMLVHVDTAEGRSSPTSDEPRLVLDHIWEGHQQLSVPAQSVMSLAPAS